MNVNGDLRTARLLDAQHEAVELFAEASDAVRDLAAELFDVERHWHKRIVRSGPNTGCCGLSAGAPGVVPPLGS